MKKRLLIIVTAIITMILCAFALVGCGVFDKNIPTHGTEQGGTGNENTGGNVPGHEHNYKVTVVGPTCVEQGYTLHKCSCGDGYQDTYTDALGHDKINHVAQKATCVNVGWNAYETCSRCYYSTYIAIPATGEHDFNNGYCITCKKLYNEGLSYALDPYSATYTVNGIGKCKDNDIYISAEYNGLPVTSIKNNAFKNCTSLTSVTIPSSVTSIGNSAFSSPQLNRF